MTKPLSTVPAKKEPMTAAKWPAAGKSRAASAAASIEVLPVR